MNNQPNVMATPSHDRHGIKCISWSAIFVGALVGLGLTFLFNLFSLGIGLTVFTTSSSGAATFAVGGFIGMLITVIISMFVAGGIAGLLARSVCNHAWMGVLYGFTTWCVALFVTMWMSFHITQLVSSYYHSLAHPEIAIIKMTNGEAYSKEASQPIKDVSSTSVSTSEEKVRPIIGGAFFIMFLFFFIGALSSCIGGYVGVKCECGKGKKPVV